MSTFFLFSLLIKYFSCFCILVGNPPVKLSTVKMSEQIFWKIIVPKSSALLLLKMSLILSKEFQNSLIIFSIISSHMISRPNVDPVRFPGFVEKFFFDLNSFVNKLHMFLIEVGTQVANQFLDSANTVLHTPVLENVPTIPSLLIAKPFMYQFQSLLWSGFTDDPCDEAVNAAGVVGMFQSIEKWKKHLALNEQP